MQKDLKFNQMQQMLEQNSLVMEKNQGQLFKAISSILSNHQTESPDTIQNKCLTELNNLISKNSINNRLHILSKNKQLYQEYKLNPGQQFFENVNLELLSNIYKKKIILYFVSEDNFLCTRIFNQNYDSTINLARLGDNYYTVNTLYLQSETQFTLQNNEIDLSDISDDIDHNFQQIIQQKLQKVEKKKSNSVQLDHDISERKISNFSQESYSSDYLSNFNNQHIYNSDVELTKKFGKIKFFDETKNFGFIVTDEDNTDIFVHQDDLIQGGIQVDQLKNLKKVHQQLQGSQLRVQFQIMTYIGKYNQSRKAVNIEII